jgi:hypothetical protein
MRLLRLLLPVLPVLSSASIAAQQHPATVTTPATLRETSLPLTHVSLYKNGVGFFEHAGHVTGDAKVTIDFTSNELNDVLQSLTAIDLNGGRISGAGYNSTTPLEQQLQNLSLGLPESADYSSLMTALRGARVAITGSGAAFTGRLVSLDERTAKDKDGNETTVGYTLTAASDAGEIRTFASTPQLSVRLLDTATHEDLTRYLELLANNHARGLRHLTIEDRGTGTRELRLSYLSQVPIWKSTYRILFTTEPGQASHTATMQGWSVVDNTTGEDWTNVQLSLIAGTPQSFVQPISQPIYARRPEVPIEQDAQLTPQTFERGYADAMSPLASPTRIAKRSRAMADMAAGAPGGVMGSMAMGMGAPPPPPPSYEEEAQASFTPNTSTAGFDDYFSYNLAEPVTIKRNESALVPILQTKVEADRVTLVTSDGMQPSQPLRALWLTNTSRFTLDRGSFTIVENGAFGGEGLLEPIHAGEKRLLSYAADQAVRVSTEGDTTTQHIDEITASQGVLKLHHADVRAITYRITNAASDARTVVLEHPIFPGYTLDSTPAPAETTARAYRFRMEVGAGKTESLHVAEQHHGATLYELTSLDDAAVQAILLQTGNDQRISSALQPILEARRSVAVAQAAVDASNEQLKSLRADEDRERSNITALASADKSARERFVTELNQTEDAMHTAQTELTARTATLAAARAELSRRITQLQLDDRL